MKYLYEELTEKIIGCCYKVHNTLGFGFLEKVYENALKVELENNGLLVEQQKPIKVYYNGLIVGDYIADLLVDNKVLLEIKAGRGIDKAHEAQLLNYLRATNIYVGLVVNFGPKVSIVRRVLENAR